MFNKKKNKRKKKTPTRTKLLWVAVLAIILYTATSLILQFVTQVSVSDTLTVSWYGFWSIELWNLSRITINRTKNGYYEKVDMVNSNSEMETDMSNESENY